MIIEYIMHKYGWTDIWYAHPGTFIYNFIWGGCFLVGKCTGPQSDLICVKDCETNEEAEKYLSPCGITILSATIKAVIKYHLLRCNEIRWGVFRMFTASDKEKWVKECKKRDEIAKKRRNNEN